MPAPAGARFISLPDQDPLTDAERARALHMAGWVKGLLENRDSRIAQLGLDPSIWLPAANWGGAQAFYKTAHDLMRGENLEWLRLLSQQFTGYALWSMRHGGPLPPADTLALQQALSERALNPDEGALELFTRLRRELPEYLRMGPPAKLGEVGWLVDDVIVNQDTAASWERLEVLYRAGMLDLNARSCLKAGSSILEIGAGYGALAYYIHRAVPGVRYTILDIPESLVYSTVYLAVLNPNAGTSFLPNYEFPALVQDGRHFDLVINTLSMTEMSEPQVRTYCEGIRKLIGTSGLFFEQNQDGRAVGLLNARDIVRDYFTNQELLGGPTLTPYLTQGFATMWSNRVREAETVQPLEPDDNAAASRSGARAIAASHAGGDFPVSNLNSGTEAPWGAAEGQDDVYAAVVLTVPRAVQEFRIWLFSPGQPPRPHLRDIRVVVADSENGQAPDWRVVRSRVSEDQPFSEKVTVPPLRDKSVVRVEIDRGDPNWGPHKIWGFGCFTASQGDARNYLPAGSGVYIRELQMR